jgi:hypothetical protein
MLQILSLFLGLVESSLTSLQQLLLRGSARGLPILYRVWVNMYHWYVFLGGVIVIAATANVCEPQYTCGACMLVSGHSVAVASCCHVLTPCPHLYMHLLLQLQGETSPPPRIHNETHFTRRARKRAARKAEHEDVLRKRAARCKSSLSLSVAVYASPCRLHSNMVVQSHVLHSLA